MEEINEIDLTSLFIPDDVLYVDLKFLAFQEPDYVDCIEKIKSLSPQVQNNLRVLDNKLLISPTIAILFIGVKPITNSIKMKLNILLTIGSNFLILPWSSPT